MLLEHNCVSKYHVNHFKNYMDFQQAGGRIYSINIPANCGVTSQELTPGDFALYSLYS
jgi:hypothetical protein